jgi:hypothetical protein
LEVKQSKIHSINFAVVGSQKFKAKKSEIFVFPHERAKWISLHYALKQKKIFANRRTPTVMHLVKILIKL